MLYDLYRRYSEPHRKYHDLMHIFRIFELARNRGIELSEEQVMAIWFHDAVYNIPALEESNEELSAELAEHELLVERGWGWGRVDEIMAMIRATEQVLQPGVPELTDEEWQVCGLDLYDFGTPNYWPNRDKIRHEWDRLSDEEWAAGRGSAPTSRTSKSCGDLPDRKRESRRSPRLRRPTVGSRWPP